MASGLRGSITFKAEGQKNLRTEHEPKHKHENSY